MLRLVTTFILTLIVSMSLCAQEELAIGQWRGFLPYQKGVYVTQSENTVYYASASGIVKVNKSDYAATFLSKLDGLSDVGMGNLRYNPFNSSLLVTYENSNMDLIRADGTVINLPDIKNNENILGSKAINNIYFKDATAYLACPFGLVTLNTETAEFGFTTFTNIKVNATLVQENYCYIATEKGLYRFDLSSAENIADFNTWQPYLSTGSAQLPSYAICSKFDALYFDRNDTLYRYANEEFIFVKKFNNYRLAYLSGEGAHLIAGYRCASSDCYGQDRVQYYTADGTAAQLGACVNLTQGAVEDAQQQIWLGDGFDGFRRYSIPDMACGTVTYNSPLSSSCYEMTFADGKLYVGAGGLQPSNVPADNSDGFFVFDGSSWRNYNTYNTNGIAEFGFGKDFFKPIASPAQDGSFYISNAYGGLANVKGDEVTYFDDSNSLLIGRKGGISADKNKNIWIACLEEFDKPQIVVYTPEGAFKRLGPVVTNGILFRCIADANNNKWFTVLGNNTSLALYNEGADLNNTSDDKSRIINLINETNDDLESTKANCLVEDLDGAVWVGTGDGIVRFECGDIFDNNCKGYRPRAVRDDITAYTLDDQDIRCIAVDGANRKWCGTSNGIVVLSPDGNQEITSFRTDNSFLFDNLINSLAINQINGEIFIGTAKGIQSIRSEAIEGKLTNSTAAYAYPNPVRPGYEGPIAIKGLARDANFKITSVSGQAVYEGRALGGQAIWDATDLNGKRVESGVYLVFIAGTQDPEDANTLVTKILVIN